MPEHAVAGEPVVEGLNRRRPTVSVVIPTYNHAGTVGEAIESVLAQTFDDYEVIVINDGSPDDTARVLEPYLDRIVYVEQPNAGQAAARNRGIAMARGEFVALLDDDDLWPADKLDWQVAALRANPEAVLVYGEDTRIDADGQPLPPAPRRDYKRPSGDAHRAFLEGCWIASPGQTLIRRDVLKRIGGFDEEIWGSDDWDLYLRLAAEGPFIYENREALRYRVHGSNASGNVLRHLAGHMRVKAKHPAGDVEIERRRRRNAAAYFLEPLLALSHDARRAGDLKTSFAAQRAAAVLDRRVLLRSTWWKPFVLNLIGKPPSAANRTTPSSPAGASRTTSRPSG